MITVDERLFLAHNRYKRPMTPLGVVAHSTGNPNASAEANWSYYNTGDRGASVHYFVDNLRIIRCVPENEQGGHVGNAWLNRMYIAVELCEMTDPAKFTAAYANYTDLLADICLRHGWNARAIVTHNEVSCTVPEDTDHTDPTGHLGRMLGITPTAQGIAKRVRADVQGKLDALLKPAIYAVSVYVDGNLHEWNAINYDSRVYLPVRDVANEFTPGATLGYSWKTKRLDWNTRRSPL